MRPATVLLLPTLLVAAPPVERPLEQRQFDFWLGDWEVRNAMGLRLGHNQVVALLGGAVLQEHWEGAKGGAGTSLNTYDPSRRRWRQRWMDSQGGTLDLEGGLQGGAMVLQGLSDGPNGQLQNRITWAPLPDGRVRQHWEQRPAGDSTWTTTFDGYYQKVPKTPGTPEKR